MASDALDGEAWGVMVSEALGGPPSQWRGALERCTSLLPECAHAWRLYINAELRMGELVRAEELFERCLLRCPQLELWKLYLSYLRIQKHAQPPELSQALSLLLQAVGDDVNSGPLWLEYVALCRDAIEPGMMQQGAQASCRMPFHARASSPESEILPYPH